MMRAILAGVLLGLAAPVLADAPPAVSAPSTQTQVEAILATAPKGTRFGLLVVNDAGTAIVSVNSDGRFIPASNTKMFTTAAAYALLQGMDQPDVAGGTQVFLESDPRKVAPNVVLVGQGDARMSSADGCLLDCLATLADAVAGKTKVVGDVIGDGSAFADERWSPGMSWNNIQTEDGTAAAALNLDDNQLKISVIPGDIGKPPIVSASAYYAMTNSAVTVPTGRKQTLVLERAIGSNQFKLSGEIPADTAEWHQWVGIDDPTHFTAWTFKRLLEARGVTVIGAVRTVHRERSDMDQPCDDCAVASASIGQPKPLASLRPAALSEDVVTINKASQNLHAQVLLYRIGQVYGTGSTAWGVHDEKAIFEKAGIPREGYDFSDGSGMSTYNRVSPRAGVALLRWIDTQPWGKAWYASLPIAGVDGTLRNRFKGTPLENNLIAKTGTLNATNALSGTFRAASGKRLTFSFFANDVPEGQSAVPTMEAVLLAVAAAN